MKHTKKLCAVAMAVVLSALCLAACGDQGGVDTPPTGGQTTPGEPTVLPSIGQDETSHSHSIVCSDGKTTLRFQHNDQAEWRWQDDMDFPLDTAYVDTLVSAVETLLQSSPIVTADTYETLGLNSTNKYITVSDDKGQSATWYLGNTSVNGRLYARVAGDESGAVYLTPAGLADQISLSIYDMMRLPSLPHIQAENISTIAIAIGEKNTVLAPHGEGHWGAGGSEDLTAKAQPLLSMLETMAIEKCVDYKPSSGAPAICGLDPARATMTVSYRDGDKTAQLVLALGTTRGESTYVRLGEDSTIYAMASATVAPILSFN